MRYNLRYMMSYICSFSPFCPLQLYKELRDSDTSSYILDFFYIHLRRHYLFVLQGKAFAIIVHLELPCSNIYSASILSSDSVQRPLLMLGSRTFYHRNLQSSFDLPSMLKDIYFQSPAPCFLTSYVNTSSSISVHPFLFAEFLI